MLLADEFVERAGPHPRGQRLGLAAIGGFGGGKEGHGGAVSSFVGSKRPFILRFGLRAAKWRIRRMAAPPRNGVQCAARPFSSDFSSLLLFAGGCPMFFAHRSVRVAKCFLVAMSLAGLSQGATACLNDYPDKKNPEKSDPYQPQHAKTGWDQVAASAYMHELTSGKVAFPSDDELETLRLAAESGDFQAKSNYAVALARRGGAWRSVEILEEIAAQYPDEYAIAANLGTAYELAGDDRKALEWITKGLRLNPASHEKSEWVHVKILEAKIAMAQDPNWMQAHSVLGLNFGPGTTPIRPTQMTTDLDGNAKTLAEVRSALEYRLRERVALVPPVDAVVADLLTDLGNLLALRRCAGPGSFGLFAGGRLCPA